MTGHKRGFMAKCAEYGIPDKDALALYDAWRSDETGKTPFPYDIMSDNPRVGSYLMPKGVNWRRGMIDEKNANGRRWTDYYPFVRASLARQSSTLRDGSSPEFLDSEARRIADDLNLRASSPETFSEASGAEYDDSALEALRLRHAALVSGRMRPGDRVVPSARTHDVPGAPDAPASLPANSAAGPVALVQDGNVKTSAYVSGFMSKCAEHGVVGAGVATMTMAMAMLKAGGLISADKATFVLPDGKTIGHVVQEWNAENPYDRITSDDIVETNDNLPATKYVAGRMYRMPARVVPRKAVAPVAEEAVAPAVEERYVPNYESFTDDQKLLAQALYDEARGQTGDMPYIAAAIYNRSGGTDHIGEVIASPKAFSGYGDGKFASEAGRDKDKAERAAWNEALRQAEAIYAEGYMPPTSATHFHAPGKPQDWSRGKKALNLAGATHKFYDDVWFERPWSATPMPELDPNLAKEYKVVSGDNFDRIHKKLGIPSEWLQRWNPDVVPKTMRIGSVIRYMPLPEDYVSLAANGQQIARELAAKRLKAAQQAQQAQQAQ